MAIRITDSGNRMVTEAVLLTDEIRRRLETPGSAHVSMAATSDTGVMAATLAAGLIGTFGKSMFGSSLFEEVADAEVAPGSTVERTATM